MERDTRFEVVPSGSQEELQVLLVSADKWEKHRKSQDTCLVRREAWEEQTIHEGQNDRSGAGSWPHGSTEGAVANEFPLERSGVEENRGLWHAPGGRVADCSVSPKGKRPSLRSWEIWYEEQSTGRQVRRKNVQFTKDQGAVEKMPNTGIWT